MDSNKLLKAGDITKKKQLGVSADRILLGIKPIKRSVYADYILDSALKLLQAYHTKSHVTAIRWRAYHILFNCWETVASIQFPCWKFCGKAGAPHQHERGGQTVYLRIRHNRYKPTKRRTELLGAAKSGVLYYCDGSLFRFLYIASPFRSSKEVTSWSSVYFSNDWLNLYLIL